MNGNKIPVVTPVLDTNVACLRYDPLPKAMRKTKPPSWFYASHTPGSVILPDLHHPTKSSVQTSGIRTEMARLDRIQEWLQSSHISPVETTRFPPKEQPTNQNNNNNVHNINSKRTSASDVTEGTKTDSAPLPKLKTKEKSVLNNYEPNFNSKFPKLGSIMTVSDDPEIVGTRVSVKAREDNWRKKKSVASLSSGKTLMPQKGKDSEFYPKILPSELTASEYERRRCKTFYGLDSSFTATNTSNQPLKRKVGPIQRPHSPVADLFLRQRTRYGDTMMHAKSPSKAFSEQQGKTYTLHAKLKDMLLER